MPRIHRPPKRKRGERLPEGEACKEILSCLITAPTPPTTTEIKRYLRRPETNIRNPTTVLGHLDTLKALGLIVPTIEKKGLSATWSVPHEISVYREIYKKPGWAGLQEPIRNLPRVSDLLITTWRDQYGLCKEWPEREGRFRLGLSITPTFFKWHIEIDPFDSPPLSIKGQEEWYRLSGEGGYFKIKTQAQEEEYFTPHAIIDTLIYRALFVDYITGGQLTEKAVEFLKADREDKERARRLVNCNAKAQQVLSFLLDPTVPPLFKPEVAKELREMAQEWEKGLSALVKQKGYTITKGLEYTCDKGGELAKRFPGFGFLFNA